MTRRPHDAADGRRRDRPAAACAGRGATCSARRLDAIVTVVLGGAALYVAFRMLRYALVTGRWEIVRVNLKLLLVGRFPDDELWKVVAARRRARAVGRAARRTRQRPPAAHAARSSVVPRQPLQRVAGLAGRFWPLLLGVGVLLVAVAQRGPVDHRRASSPSPPSSAASSASPLGRLTIRAGRRSSRSSSSCCSPPCRSC